MIESIPTSLIVIVIAGAFLSGLASLGNVNYVYFKHQLFGAGGAALAIIGTVLMGFSLWSNIQVEIAGSKVVLQRVAEAIAEEPELAETVVAQAIQKKPELGVALVQELGEQNPDSLVAAFAGSRPDLAAKAIDGLIREDPQFGVMLAQKLQPPPENRVNASNEEITTEQQLRYLLRNRAIALEEPDTADDGA